MKKKIKVASSMKVFIDLCTSKRYSGARIKRTIIHILNNTKKEYAISMLSKPIEYIRVLGFNEKGAKYLSLNRKELLKLLREIYYTSFHNYHKMHSCYFVN